MPKKVKKEKEVLSSGSKELSKEPKELSKEEQVGFHKGSLSVLVKERDELGRLLSIVESLIKLHAEEIRKFGVAAGKQGKEKEKKLEEALS